MASYDPNAQICINETVVNPGIVVNSVSITGGRFSVDEQPRASIAAVSLISAGGTLPDIELNQCLRVTVDNSAGLETRIFQGSVTDISRNIVANNSGDIVVELRLTALSALAKLQNLETAASYPKQFDGERVYAILSDSILTAWDEVPATQTWATLDPTVTWATYDSENFVGTIDTPGNWELTAYDGGVTNAKSLLDLTALSGLGVLYEKADGSVNYETGGGRSVRVAADGFNTLPVAYIQAVGLEATQRIGDIYNQFTVTYKNDQSEFLEDAESVRIYGKNAGGVSTQLEHKADAENQTAFYLATRANPRRTVETVSVPLHNPNISDTERDALLSLFCGYALQIPDLPEIVGGGFAGFVEGYRYQITNKTMLATLTLSPFEMTAIPQTWENVTATITWDDVAPSLVWNDAKIVG